MRPTRVLSFLGKTVQIALVTAVILAGALALRLAAGPIPLGPFEPMLARAVESAGPFRVAFEDPALAWSREQGTLQLKVSDVEVRTPDGGTLVAAAPEVGLRLDLPALVRGGDVRLREVEVALPALQLTRHPDEELVLSFGGHLGALPLSAATRGDLLGRLAGGRPEAEDSRFDRLRRIRVTARSLRYVDERSGRVIESGGARLRLTRDPAGWEARLDVREIGGAAGSRVRLAVAPAEGGSDLQRVEVAVTSLPVAALDGLLPDVPLEQIALPISAEARLTFDPAARVPGPGTFRATAPAWTVTAPDLFEQPVSLGGAVLAGEGDAGWRNIRLTEGEVRAGQATIVRLAAGALHRGEDGRSLKLDLKAERLDAATLTRLWPLPLAPAVRRWVVGHVDAGSVPSARIEASQPAGGGTSEPVLALDFAIRDATTRFLEGWPAAEGIQGKGHLDRRHFVLDLGAGRIGELAASKARLTFDGLQSPEPIRLSLALDAAGPVPAALDLLARDPIDLPDRLGVAPGQTAGRVQASVSLSLPLGAEVKAAQVKRQVEATLADLAVKNIREGYDLRDGRLKVAVDDARAEITGDVALNTVPVRLEWLERLDGAGGKGGERRHVHVAGTLGQDGARALNVPWPDGVAGRMPLTGTVTEAERGPRRVRLEGDLAGLRVDLPRYGLTKEPGRPGRLEAQLEQPDERRLTIAAATVGWADVALQGGAELRLSPANAGRGWQRIDLRAVRTPTAELTATLARAGDGMIRAEVDAQRLDLRPYRAAAAGEGPGAANAAQDLALDLRAARLFVGPEPLESVTLRAERRAGRITDLAATARVPGGDAASFNVAARQLPGEFSGETDDLGAFLRAIDLPQPRIEDGRARVAGRIEAGEGGRLVWGGEAKLREFTVRDTPFLARLLTLASLQGLVNTLGGRGLRVERVTVPFTWRDGRVELRQARAVGSGLGVRVDGTVDTAGRTLDLNGTFAPLYAINRLLGQIPILGNLLRGDKADAALAATFSVAGPFDDPRVTVNPLAALVPGFLRDLFGDLIEGAEPVEGERELRD